MPQVHRYGRRAAALAGLGFVVLLGSISLAAAQNSPPAPAQASPPGAAPTQPVTPAPQYFTNHMSANLKLADYLDRLRREFRTADADVDGEITEADAVLSAQLGAAGFRAVYLAQLFSFDLDGDGVVTEDELRRVLTYKRYASDARLPAGTTAEQQTESQIRQLMAADADHDGRITLEEALKYLGSQLNPTQYLSNNVRQLIALAPDGKKALTLSDFEAAAEAAFRAVDADGDGVVSTEELKNYFAQSGQSNLRSYGMAAPVTPPRNEPPPATIQPAQEREIQARLEEAAKRREALMQQRKAQQEQARREAEEQRAKKEAEARAACPMPQASDSADVVLIGAREAEALSNATIGSQDIAVGVGNITVEPGARPIYLVIVTLDPTIWRFYGATERIERLVLTASRVASNKFVPRDKPLVGATGVPAERITFLGDMKCIDDFTDVPSSQASKAGAVVQREAGKSVAVTAARYSLSDVSIPSGKVTSLREQDRRLVVISQSAGSLNIIGDPKNFILQAGPSNPETELKRSYPGGVIQIDARSVVASAPVEPYQVLPRQAGLVQLMKSGKIEQNRGGEFMIKEKIRFPAELTGGLKFLLLRGVAQPEGDPGQSEVISEESGKPVEFDPSSR